jgi:hypothetical protein
MQTFATQNSPAEQVDGSQHASFTSPQGPASTGFWHVPLTQVWPAGQSGVVRQAEPALTVLSVQPSARSRKPTDAVRSIVAPILKATHP